MKALYILNTEKLGYNLQVINNINQIGFKRKTRRKCAFMRRAKKKRYQFK